MSYSFSSFGPIKGPRLHLRRMESQDLASLGPHLISPTTWFSQTRGINNLDRFIEYYERLLERQARQEMLILVAEYNNELVGMSSFQYPSEGFRRIEIGFTWIADRWQRSFVNSELKLLMLDYAFNIMGTHRVEFSVHPKNTKSNQSMQRLGATLEGTLRKWRFLPGNNPDDGNRNLYSIIDEEWPELRKKLIARN